MTTDIDLEMMRVRGFADEADEIERLRAELGDLPEAQDMLLTQLKELRAQVEGLRADADRYRWLRDGCCDKGTVATHIARDMYGMEWDAAIDAARGKT